MARKTTERTIEVESVAALMLRLDAIDILPPVKQGLRHLMAIYDGGEGENSYERFCDAMDQCNKETQSQFVAYLRKNNRGSCIECYSIVPQSKMGYLITDTRGSGWVDDGECHSYEHWGCVSIYATCQTCAKREKKEQGKRADWIGVGKNCRWWDISHLPKTAEKEKFLNVCLLPENFPLEAANKIGLPPLFIGWALGMNGSMSFSAGYGHPNHLNGFSWQYIIDFQCKKIAFDQLELLCA